MLSETSERMLKVFTMPASRNGSFNTKYYWLQLHRNLFSTKYTRTPCLFSTDFYNIRTTSLKWHQKYILKYKYWGSCRVGFFSRYSSGSKYITFPASLILLQNLVLHMNDHLLFIRIQKYNWKYAVIGNSR